MSVLVVFGALTLSGVVPNMVTTRVIGGQAEVYSNSPTTEIRVVYKDGSVQSLFGCLQGCPIGDIDKVATVQMEAE